MGYDVTKVACSSSCAYSCGDLGPFTIEFGSLDEALDELNEDPGLCKISKKLLRILYFEYRTLTCEK